MRSELEDCLDALQREGFAHAEAKKVWKSKERRFTAELERLQENYNIALGEWNSHIDANRALREKLPRAWEKGAAHGYKVGKYGHESHPAGQCAADLRALDAPDSAPDKEVTDG